MADAEWLMFIGARPHAAVAALRCIEPDLDPLTSMSCREMISSPLKNCVLKIVAIPRSFLRKPSSFHSRHNHFAFGRIDP